MLEERTMSTGTTAPSRVSDHTSGPDVYLCVGLPGAGKSTWAKTMVKHLPSWVRVNQDEMGSRDACLKKARLALREGKSIIVDRCNFNRSQRAYWVNLAKEFNSQVVAVVFHTPPEECVRRAKLRPHHETMTEPHKFWNIIFNMHKDSEPPTCDEGIDRVVHVDYSNNIVTQGNAVGASGVKRVA